VSIKQPPLSHAVVDGNGVMDCAASHIAMTGRVATGGNG
jgi:hypothetical protein